MVKKKSAVHVTPREDGWAVIREGNQRASSVHPTQKEAEQKGRETARKDRTEFFLHNRQGEIRQRDIYGSDRYRYPDIRRTVHKYTDEELRRLAEEDKLDPERAQRLQALQKKE